MGEWKAVTHGDRIDIKKNKGTPYVGVYKGSEQTSTKIGPQVVYNFEDEDGKSFGIYGFTNLNRAMSNITVGMGVRITYAGTKNVETKYGKKDVHQVDVEVFEKSDGDPEGFPLPF